MSDEKKKGAEIVDLERALKASLGLNDILEEARESAAVSTREAHEKRQRFTRDDDPVGAAHLAATARVAARPAGSSREVRRALEAFKPRRRDDDAPGTRGLDSAQAEGRAARRARIERAQWAVRNDYTTRQLDALEKYAHALEDLVRHLDPAAPLLRGTWRPEAYHSSSAIVRVFGRVARHWQMGAVEVRRYLSKKKTGEA